MPRWSCSAEAKRALLLWRILPKEPPREQVHRIEARGEHLAHPVGRKRQGRGIRKGREAAPPPPRKIGDGRGSSPDVIPDPGAHQHSLVIPAGDAKSARFVNTKSRSVVLENAQVYVGQPKGVMGLGQ